MRRCVILFTHARTLTFLLHHDTTHPILTQDRRYASEEHALQGVSSDLMSGPCR